MVLNMKEILKTMIIFILLIAILGTLIYICQENVNPNISYAASSIDHVFN